MLYQEPPETIEHMSDQAALPNLNANWVNAKGESLPYQRSDNEDGLNSSFVSTGFEPEILTNISPKVPGQYISF